MCPHSGLVQNVTSWWEETLCVLFIFKVLLSKANVTGVPVKSSPSGPSQSQRNINIVSYLWCTFESLPFQGVQYSFSLIIKNQPAGAIFNDSSSGSDPHPVAQIPSLNS